MKKLLNSYLSFTRTERIGLVCLCSLLLIIITVRATMSLWVSPNVDLNKEKKLVTAWQMFKRDHPAKPDTVENTDADYKDAFDENDTPLPGIIDLNTADSATLVRLKGIGPATAAKIIERRKKYRFTNVDQLLEIRHIPEATFTVLKKHLTVNTSLQQSN